MTVMAFSGTRLGMTRIQKDLVANLLDTVKPSEVHHGDCVGADEELHRIAAAMATMRIVVHPPANESLRAFCRGDEELEPLPYLVRNAAMVTVSGMLVAAPASAMVAGGTWWTINEAGRQEKRTIIIYPDGRIVDR